MVGFWGFGVNGFIDHVQHLEYFEAEISPIFHLRSLDDSKILMSYIFEVDAIGQ